MAFSVVMPALEMAQETGKLIAWRKREGDRVSKGEPLLEIETDKAVMEVEAPADGILAGIKAAEGVDIPVGQTIAWIVEPGEQPPTDEAPSAPGARASTTSRAEPASFTPAATSTATQSAKISPKARRLAKELGVELADVRGSGAGGEILASDVQAAHLYRTIETTLRPEDSGPHGRPGTGVPTSAERIEVPTSIGRLMAERTTESWTTIPHFFVSREVEAAALNRERARIASEILLAHDLKITHTDFLIALVARVLLKHPRLNGSWSADGIRLHDHVHMGLAIAVNEGVVAAVIPNAHKAGLAEIASRRHEVAERARAGKLRPSDIADATFTLSNLGMYHVDSFSAIITAPQAGILAVGAISDRVVAVEGQAVVRPMMTLTLSCDHRVVDGAKAAVFLNDLAEAIGAPGKWLA